MKQLTDGLGWPSIIRLGLVQSALGGIVMLSSSMLNRIMIVEYALPAIIPAALVAWHFGVQVSRPHWGHKSDRGDRRGPWIVGGMSLLALGGLLATDAMIMANTFPTASLVLLILAYSMIGFGVGAAGTSLLALLASHVHPSRRPAAAAVAWIMMVAGIIITAGVAGSFLDPFTPQRLALVAGGVSLSCFLLTLLALWGVEKGQLNRYDADAAPPAELRAAMREVWSDPSARRLTLFIFISMMAYSAQDLILEPFAGLIFNYTPGQSTKLSSLQHMGVLIGMIMVGVIGNAFKGNGMHMRPWIVGGCAASALALLAMAVAALSGGSWPLQPTVFMLGFANGIFAVSAIAAMMELAGSGAKRQEGARMGLWGAAQAIAFALGGFAGAGGVDWGRAALGDTPSAFFLVFSLEAIMFAAAAILAISLRKDATAPAHEGQLGKGGITA
jgi:MFS transporter, BCD family, chlorophyll transporter